MPHMNGWTRPDGTKVHRLVRHIGDGTKTNPMQTVVFSADEWSVISRAVLEQHSLVSLADYDQINQKAVALAGEMAKLEAEFEYAAGLTDD